MPEHENTRMPDRPTGLVEKLEALAARFAIYGTVTILAVLHESRLGRLEVNIAASDPDALSRFPAEDAAPGGTPAFYLQLWMLLDYHLSRSKCRFGTCSFFLQGAVLQRAEVNRSVLLSKEKDLLDGLLYD